MSVCVRASTNCKSVDNPTIVFFTFESHLCALPEPCKLHGIHNCTVVEDDGYECKSRPSRTKLVHWMDQPTKDVIREHLQPMVEEWTGVDLVFEAIFGIRRYLRGGWVGAHTDKAGEGLGGWFPIGTSSSTIILTRFPIAKLTKKKKKKKTRQQDGGLHPERGPGHRRPPVAAQGQGPQGKDPRAHPGGRRRSLLRGREVLEEIFTITVHVL